MRVRLGGISTVLVAVATTTCGVLMLGGVGPSSAGDGLTGEALPTVAPATSATGEDPSPSTTTIVQSSSLTSTTLAATSTTTTIAATSTTTTIASTPSPLPLSVSASQTVVGAGGTVDFAGTCPTIDGSAPGSLVVWVISDTTDVIDTGVTATEWTYQWTAPTDENEIASHTFQFWCGDPSGRQGGYPADLQRTVDIVAQALPLPATVTPLIEAGPDLVIPETD